MTTVPTQQGALDSLMSAADAARKAYMTANAANPTADLGSLYKLEMQAQTLAAGALDKELQNAPNVATAQTALDNASSNIRNNLAHLTDVATCLTALTNLVKLAATLSTFFA